MPFPAGNQHVTLQSHTQRMTLQDFVDVCLTALRREHEESNYIWPADPRGYLAELFEWCRGPAGGSYWMDDPRAHDAIIWRWRQILSDNQQLIGQPVPPPLTAGQLAEMNLALFTRLESRDPVAEQEALDAINDFTRTRMREEGFFRRILPPVASAAPNTAEELQQAMDRLQHLIQIYRLESELGDANELSRMHQAVIQALTAYERHRWTGHLEETPARPAIEPYLRPPLLLLRERPLILE